MKRTERYVLTADGAPTRVRAGTRPAMERIARARAKSAPQIEWKCAAAVGGEGAGK